MSIAENRINFVQAQLSHFGLKASNWSWNSEDGLEDKDAHILTIFVDAQITSVQAAFKNFAMPAHVFSVDDFVQVDIDFMPEVDAMHERLDAQRKRFAEIARKDAQHAVEAAALTIALREAQTKIMDGCGIEAFYWQMIIWFGGAFYCVGKDAYTYRDEPMGVLEPKCSTRIGPDVQNANAWIQAMYGRGVDWKGAEAR